MKLFNLFKKLFAKEPSTEKEVNNVVVPSTSKIITIPTEDERPQMSEKNPYLNNAPNFTEMLPGKKH